MQQQRHLRWQLIQCRPAHAWSEIWTMKRCRERGRIIDERRRECHHTATAIISRPLPMRNVPNGPRNGKRSLFPCCWPWPGDGEEWASSSAKDGQINTPRVYPLLLLLLLLSQPSPPCLSPHSQGLTRHGPLSASLQSVGRWSRRKFISVTNVLKPIKERKQWPSKARIAADEKIMPCDNKKVAATDLGY